MFGEVTINDIEVQDIKQGNLDDNDQNNEDSTATDDDYFEDAKEVEAEDEKAYNLEEEVGDDEVQRDYFNSNVDEVSVVNENDEEDETEENNDIDDEVGDVEADDGEEEEIKDEGEPDDEISAEAEEEVEEESKTEEKEVARPRIRHEVSSTLRNYWNELAGAVMETEKRVHDMMNNYYTMTASPATPQYGFAKGLKLFGKEGLEATYKELKNNLLDRDCVRMLRPEEVTVEVKKKGITLSDVLKCKRTGNVKGRGVADGRSQSGYVTKEESFSPTVSLNALIVTCIIDAIEERKITTVDIPGAFLQALWPKGNDCYVKFEGVMVDIICKIDKKYEKCVKESKYTKRKFLYGKLNRALYGTVLGAKLFYDKLSSELIKLEFETNPYDECTFNKMVNGEQLTVVFHVDDLKASHKQQAVLDEFISELKAIFGKQDELTESTGLMHEYLGMNLDYSIPGKIAFTMYKYLEDIIVEAPEDSKKKTFNKYPANDNLFKASDDAKLLGPKNADLFHRLVARLLYASKRARPDIAVAIAFLCTRVKQPTEEDYAKLGKVITYVRDSIHIPLILGADGSGTMTWNIDVSYAVHPDCKSHTGAACSLGHGTFIPISSKQELLTKSSTESDLVAVDDAMIFLMWAKHFFE